MGREITRNRIEMIIDKFNSRKRFFVTESEGLGPCSIILLSHVNVYDEVLKKLEILKSDSVTEQDVITIIDYIKEKIKDCYRSETYESEKMIIKIYDEIIEELEGLF